MQLRFVLRLMICLALLSSAANSQAWIAKSYEVDTVRNLVYGRAINFNNEYDTLSLDLYLPRCSEAATHARPLLIWIHGGAFLAGSKEDPSIMRLCNEFARRGYVCASLNYRLGFVSDSIAWNCNYPNYSCVFAADTIEWIRAWYRGVQDAKGALRWLVHRAATYHLDPSNVFLAGESAGSFIAMGVAYLDTAAERPLQTYSMSSLPPPVTSARSCLYAAAKHFSTARIERPDLGDITGNIELDSTSAASNISIKAVGNNYGGMISDLLRLRAAGTPAIPLYNFHQPCDIVVPVDSGPVYQGLSWCMTNGYGCYGIAHTPKVYGSRTITRWNSQRGYGYEMHDEFTSVEFPYAFFLVPGSCVDQVNTPCHAYDNPSLRETNLAQFFASKVSSVPCDSTLSDVVVEKEQSSIHTELISEGNVRIRSSGETISQVEMFSMLGQRVPTPLSERGRDAVTITQLRRGAYVVVVQFANNTQLSRLLFVP